MKRPLPVLDLDLLIEHGGYQLKLKGVGTRITATFPTLLAAFHFVRAFLPFRRRFPRELSLYAEWRGICVPVSPVMRQL